MTLRCTFPTPDFLGRLAFGIWLLMGLSGCLQGAPPSRAQTGAQILLAPEKVMFDVRDIQVLVPRSLTVSEANTFRPRAKIVWHGDPAGDRHAQVERIVRDAMQAATVQNRTGRPVVVQVEVLRFHALTPKSRLTFGGKHDLEYALTLRDASTGEVIRHLPFVSASVDGAGGETARLEEAAGRTEKVVIQQALMASISRQLTEAAQRPSPAADSGLGSYGRGTELYAAQPMPDSGFAPFGGEMDDGVAAVSRGGAHPAADTLVLGALW